MGESFRVSALSDDNDCGNSIRGHGLCLRNWMGRRGLAPCARRDGEVVR